MAKGKVLGFSSEALVIILLACWPKISEKSMALAERNVYAFTVPTSTNKVEIAKAVAKSFNVQVLSVHTITVHGKNKRFRQIRGRQVDVKKALVTIKAGQSIKLFEGAS